ncbi:M23 family metallopeptidase [Mesobacillus foraminis]|uniref:peptidoglycan DD-metalloendopeptidase family protein n=1 Tax=Mesobacillus foraminis TaxID=279826 RepID=UPI001BE59B02|nr:M23 family metallopeptidase [Mesobacillus foraminis]MBT2756493.1 M23 family metallopeptidase [Mesobacillus foraminis]
MKGLKLNLPKFATQIKRNINRIIVYALMSTALTLGTGALSTEAAEADLTTVYHVYKQDHFIGTVTDKNEVVKVIEEKTNSLVEVYDGLDLELGKDLSYVPEQVFQSASTANTEIVLDKLENELTVLAKAAVFAIDGKEIAYVKDIDSAQEVIRQLKLDFVTENELKDLENRRKSTHLPLPPLKKDETRLLDVRLSEDVSISADEIEPEKILSIEEAVKLVKNGTLEEKKYEVQPGDVLGTIADDHKLSLQQLLTLNQGLSGESVLKPGQKLKVTYHEPYAKVIVDKEVYREETVDYQKEVITDSSMFKGDTKVKQEGRDGLKGITYSITEENGRVTQQKEIEETVLKEPIKEITIKGTKVIPSRGDGNFIWPASGGYISSKMGYRWGKIHKGIDIARPSNLTIKSADNGVVLSAGYDNGGYGNKVVIDHQNGYRTIYAHLDSISVSSGQTVPRGSKIGVMGSTGDSTGVHLHFEVYKNGNRIDPLNVVGK